jgi:hypothetical protein
MAEGFVQVAPDGGGKKIRNVQVLVQQPDGSLATVYMQAVAILDEDGNAVRFSDGLDLQQHQLDELRAVRLGIQTLVDWLNPVSSTVRPGVVPTGAARVGMPLPAQIVEDNELIDMARDLRDDEDA